jgi:hypothetical protein
MHPFTHMSSWHSTKITEHRGHIKCMNLKFCIKCKINCQFYETGNRRLQHSAPRTELFLLKDILLGSAICIQSIHTMVNDSHGNINFKVKHLFHNKGNKAERSWKTYS